MADSKTAKRKPVFTKVDQLRPGTNGHNLTVKVVSSKMVLQKGKPDVRPMQIAECLIGDETGTIVFTARNDQACNDSDNPSTPSIAHLAAYSSAKFSFAWDVDMMKPDTTVILRNAKIDMFKGSMRLAVDKWGRIEVTEPGSFSVREDNNLSLVEYELVNVVEE
ncbi:hypothetical protein Ancab_003994 [Ancistrocladus abbreviatus]